MQVDPPFGRLEAGRAVEQKDKLGDPPAGIEVAVEARAVVSDTVWEGIAVEQLFEPRQDGFQASQDAGGGIAASD